MMNKYFHIDNGGYRFLYNQDELDHYGLTVGYDYMSNSSLIHMGELTPTMLKQLGEAMIEEANKYPEALGNTYLQMVKEESKKGHTSLVLSHPIMPDVVSWLEKHGIKTSNLFYLTTLYWENADAT